MITPEYCRVMARYNAWQNNSLWHVVEKIPLAELDQDRGAFFGSIRATLNHLLWGDLLWMGRFDGGEPPTLDLKESVNMTPTMPVWWAERFRTDGRIRVWANELSALDIVGTITWTSMAAGRDITKPTSHCITHFFNHQTHHRGQVHAMLTALGHKMDDTDLVLLPEDG